MATKLIAEIGWNHMGDMRIAEEMVKEAAESGAFFAKFQTWKVDRLKSGSWDHDGRREIYEKAELTKEKHEFLIESCKRHNIKFLSSAFSVETLNRSRAHLASPCSCAARAAHISITPSPITPSCRAILTLSRKIS